MSRKFVAEAMLSLLLVSVFAPTFYVQLVKAEPRTWTVDDNGPADFLKIQEAINSEMVAEGDTIFVRNGTYYENVVVNKSLSLAGENKYATVIDGKHVGQVVHISADHVNLSQFTIRNSGPESVTDINCGVLVRAPLYVNITDNIVTNNYCGIRLFAGSSNATLLRNTVSYNYFGVLHRSTYSTWRNNSLISNSYHFYLDAYSLPEYTNDIDNSNKVGSKPIYYWINEHDKTVPADAGNVVIVNSTNITIRDLTLTKNGAGLYLAYTRNSTILNCILQGNWHAIKLDESYDNNISDNDITSSYYDGVVLYGSSRNTVKGNYLAHFGDSGIYVGQDTGFNAIETNYITDAYFGIQLARRSNHNMISNNHLTGNRFGAILRTNSSNNVITGNILMNNEDAVYLYEASSNFIHHNNFDNNIGQIYDESSGNPSVPPSINTWDNGYPYGGTYWSNYDGADLRSGLYQNETGSDGIGDTPFILYANNTDAYPLMGYFGSHTMLGINATVFPTYDVGLIYYMAASEGSTYVNRTSIGPQLDSSLRLLGDYYDIETTAYYYGKIQVRIVYNGSMPEEEEDTLRLRQWDEASNEWIDITTRIDMQSNVIYGETPHLSMFGITALRYYNRTYEFPVNANATTFNVSVKTNADVSNFTFDENSKTISYTVEGEESTKGFCNVTVPKDLMWCDNQDEWTVKINGTITQRFILEDEEHTYIYFEYSYSTKTIQIQSTHAAPEFPSIMVIPLLLIATLLTMMVNKKRRSKT